MLQSALDLDRRQKAVARRALAQARALRGGSLATLVDAVATAQLEAANASLAAVPRILLEQGMSASADAETRPRALTYMTSQGGSLDGLLGFTQSPEVTQEQFDKIVLTQLSDVARQASMLASAVRPSVTGYVRMLEQPSCSRCVVQAGKFFRVNKGFQRHPHCFPAGTVVSGPQALRATRRWYEGELVTIRTAGGKQLAVTGNHPILTGQGWLPARFLDEGCDVVGRSLGDRAVGLEVPHHHQMPALIEDVWRSGGVDSLRSVPVSAEDFHGDGVGGHVDVVSTDGSLWSHDEPSVFEHEREFALSIGAVSSVALPHVGTDAELSLGHLGSALGGVGGGDLLSLLGTRHLGGSEQPGARPVAKFYAGGCEAPLDGVAARPDSLGDGVDALAAFVGGPDGAVVDAEVSPRWDAPGDPYSMETRVAYASRGHDLLFRLASQVELDRVVDVVRVQWSGHVYNLTSEEGWYEANGLIVSNCDCRHIPSSESVAGDLTVDPSAYFDSLSRTEQNRAFTNAGAEAIRNGADMGRVVNARSGMTTAQTATGRRRLVTKDVFGRPVYATRAAGGRGRIRLMPESIIPMADGDRGELLRLLKVHGYIR